MNGEIPPPPVPDVSEKPQDYFFIFHPLQHNGEHTNHYVKMHGLYEEVRLAMNARYNEQWFAFYNDLSRPEMQGKTEIQHFM